MGLTVDSRECEKNEPKKLAPGLLKRYSENFMDAEASALLEPIAER
jgi:hypothetical protein